MIKYNYVYCLFSLLTYSSLNSHVVRIVITLRPCGRYIFDTCEFCMSFPILTLMKAGCQRSRDSCLKSLWGYID